MEKKGIKRQTENIEDCKYNQICLQLSLYRYLIEKGYEVKIKSQHLLHLKDDQAKHYLCDYMPDTIESMLNTRLDQSQAA